MSKIKNVSVIFLILHIFFLLFNRANEIVNITKKSNEGELILARYGHDKYYIYIIIRIGHLQSIHFYRLSIISECMFFVFLLTEVDLTMMDVVGGGDGVDTNKEVRLQSITSQIPFLNM